MKDLIDFPTYSSSTSRLSISASYLSIPNFIVTSFHFQMVGVIFFLEIFFYFSAFLGGGGGVTTLFISIKDKREDNAPRRLLICLASEKNVLHACCCYFSFIVHRKMRKKENNVVIVCPGDFCYSIFARYISTLLSCGVFGHFSSFLFCPLFLQMSI